MDNKETKISKRRPAFHPFFVTHQLGSDVVARIYVIKSVVRFLAATLFAVFNLMELVVSKQFKFQFSCGEQNFKNNGIENPDQVFTKLDFRWILRMMQLFFTIWCSLFIVISTIS